MLSAIVLKLKISAQQNLFYSGSLMIGSFQLNTTAVTCCELLLQHKGKIRISSSVLVGACDFDTLKKSLNLLRANLSQQR